MKTISKIENEFLKPLSFCNIGDFLVLGLGKKWVS